MRWPNERISKPAPTTSTKPSATSATTKMPADDRRASAAEGDARGNFGGPRRAADQHETGDVHAADEQYQSHGGPQDEQRFSDGGGHAVLERHQLHRQSKIGGWMELVAQCRRS